MWVRISVISASSWRTGSGRRATFTLLSPIRRLPPVFAKPLPSMVSDRIPPFIRLRYRTRTVTRRSWFVRPENRRTHTLSRQEVFPEGQTLSVLPTRRLDGFTTIGDPDVVKIDADTAEYAIWHGMAGLFATRRPMTVFLEFALTRYARPTAFLADIQKAGFSLARLELEGGIRFGQGRRHHLSARHGRPDAGIAAMRRDFNASVAHVPVGVSGGQHLRCLMHGNSFLQIVRTSSNYHPSGQRRVCSKPAACLDRG